VHQVGDQPKFKFIIFLFILCPCNLNRKYSKSFRTWHWYILLFFFNVQRSVGTKYFVYCKLHARLCHRCDTWI